MIEAIFLTWRNMYDCQFITWKNMYEFMGKHSCFFREICMTVNLFFCRWYICIYLPMCVAACCNVAIELQCVAVCCSVLQCVAVCCSVLQCVAVCCSVL